MWRSYTHTIGSFVRTLSGLYAQNLFTYIRFPAMKGGMPRGRPPKGKQNRERLTLRLPPDTIAAVKRAAKRQKKSQADVINDAVRPVLIAEGFIKEKQ